jgi:hypothetical protein
MMVTKGSRPLADREALAELTGRSVHTIRARCTVADRDRRTGRALYDVLACVEMLRSVPTRKRRRA